MRAAPRPRIFVTQPVAKSAVARLRQVATVTVNPDSSRILARPALLASVRRCDILFCLLHDRIDAGVIGANPRLRLIAAQSITPSHIDVAAATARGIAVTAVPPLTTETTADLAFGLMLAVARRIVAPGNDPIAPASPPETTARAMRSASISAAESGAPSSSFVCIALVAVLPCCATCVSSCASSSCPEVLAGS